MTATPPPRADPGATMRALVLRQVGDLRLEDVPRPALREGCALVRVGFCGVCGSDIPRIFVKGTYRFPTVCGHEFAGTVEAVGRGVDGFRPGDRVAVFPLIWCGRCEACADGRYAQCRDYDYLGSRSDGAFAEYVVAPAKNLVRVPAGVSLAAAAMNEPAAVALHALRQGGGTGPGETVAVFGIGPIGLLCAQWARAMGAARVLLFDIEAPKLALARCLGFPEAFDSSARSPVEVVEAETRGEGAHLTVDAAGVPATFLQALAAARRGGRAVILGNPSADVTLPAALVSQLLRRELSVHGAWNSRFSDCGEDDDWREALAAMASGRLDVESLVTHRVDLDGAAAMLEAMRDKREFYAKVLVRP
jgi:L-iditol 2-dehydrogenase